MASDEKTTKSLLSYLLTGTGAGLFSGYLAGIVLAVIVIYLNSYLLSSLTGTACLFIFICIFLALYSGLAGLVSGLLLRMLYLLTHHNFKGSLQKGISATLSTIALIFLTQMMQYSVLGYSPSDRLAIYLFISSLFVILVVRILILGKRLKFSLWLKIIILSSPVIIIASSALLSGLTESVNVTVESTEKPGLPYNTASQELTLLAVDGATWDIICPMVKMGRLPNIACMIKEGTTANCLSFNPMRSPLIWTSIATGKRPEKHGVTNFVVYRMPISGDLLLDVPSILNFFKNDVFLEVIPVTSLQRTTSAVWNILSQAGRSVTLLGWWATWPAEALKGAMLSDRAVFSRFNPGSSGQDFTLGQAYPNNFIHLQQSRIVTPSEIRPATTELFMEIQKGNHHLGDTMDPYHEFQLAYSACETYRQVLNHTWRKYPTEFTAIYFEGIDNVSHFFYKEMQPDLFEQPVSESAIAELGRVIPRFYSYQDSCIGDLLEACPDRMNFMLVSDHGFQPSRPGAYQHYIFESYATHSGTHKLEGVALFCGPAFLKGQHVDPVSVLDMTPTILNLMGLPVARDMDGHILAEVMREQVFIARAPLDSYDMYFERRQGSYTSPADDVLKAKMRGLGYIK